MFGGKCFGQAAVSFDAGKCENFGKLDIPSWDSIE